MPFRQENVTLSDSEFLILRDLIRERTGLQYENGKNELLADKLSGRVLERGFDSFIDYYYLLKYGPGSEEEWAHVMDALSVPETYFWREMDQVRALVNVVVPHYVAARRPEPLRIWSAACATGEEPLTLAMALQEEGWLDRFPIQIQASDASPGAIARARLGVYRERSFRALPPLLRAKFFTEIDNAWRVAPELHARINWEVANITAPHEVARLPAAPIVFCRNVFIYFSPAAIAKTVALFAQRMPPPGYLFVGVAESLLRLNTDFELQEIGGAFVYLKR